MTLNISYTKIYGIPVAPDGIQQGETQVSPVVVNAGDFSTTANVNVKTFTADLKGISLSAAENIIDDVNANMQAMLLGQVNIQTGAGLIGAQNYRNHILYPIEATENGGLKVGDSDENLPTFPVRFITNELIGRLG